MGDAAVLLVDDDASILRMLERTLRAEGYDVAAVADGGAALASVERSLPDLVVLDVAMPGLDGLAVTRRLRAKRLPVPILLLTARDALEERVAGLDAGADDYVVKPFEIEELVARVRALLRRVAGIGKTTVGTLTIDTRHRRVVLGSTPLELTTREYALLSYLARRADQIVTRSELLSHVWSTRFDPGSNLVEVHMSRLRDKLGRSSWMIETVRGAGYRLRARRAD
jgi:DNA-binding response OmpR family regulator